MPTALAPDVATPGRSDDAEPPVVGPPEPVPPHPVPPHPVPPHPVPPHPVPPGPTVVDVRLMQVAIEQATRAGGEAAGLDEAELVDEIAALESLGNAVAALQADRIETFARVHAAARVDLEGEGLDPNTLDRSIGAQIGLACRVSPTQGRSRLRTARLLRRGLEHVWDLFAAGELSRDQAAAIAGATADLDPHQRATVDRRLAEHDLTALGLGRVRDLARSIAAAVGPEKFRARAATAHGARRVTLRPGEDGMCWLTAHLPVEQGAACLAALRRAFTDLSVSPAPLTRTRGQVEADTLVERLTGQATAEQVDVEIQAIVPVEALLDPDSALPVTIPGLGPVPVERLLSSRTGRMSLRRLLTRAGIVIGRDSRQRSFTGVLAELLRARDHHRCREPYCDAPIRHGDHIRRSADGGDTALDNGRGVCEFHNYLREQPGWIVESTPNGIRTTTPTGHTYTSPTPRAA